MNSQDEIVTIVDEQNNITGCLPRSEMRRDRRLHRASYILVFNSRGELFVQKRTLTKDVYPGYYDIAVGGVVLSEESYEECARREIHEEIGAQNTCLNFLFDFFHDASGNGVWGRAYNCVYDGEIRIQEEEIESGEFMNLDALLELNGSKPFTPDGMYVLNRYLKEHHDKAMDAGPDIDFDAPVDRRHTWSWKWNQYENNDDISLWLADLDFESPPAVKRELIKRAQHGVFGYTLPPDELAEEIVAMLRLKYRWEVKPDWIVWLPGLVTGINASCRAMAKDGEDVLTAVPVYPPFLTAPGYSRQNLVTVPLVKTQGRWTFDFDALEQAITPATRLFILCNPHNPTGSIYTRKELHELSRICLKHGVSVCSDEIHCDLLLDADKAHIPYATLSPEAAGHSITLMAPSKTYNIPGLGCSYAVIPDPDLKKKFIKSISGIVPLINLMGFTAALAAYREGGPWLERLLEYLRKNHDYLLQAVNEIPGLRMDRAEATYLAWIDTRETGLPDPVQVFKKNNVILSDGKDFQGPGYVRLNFGCHRSLLEKAVEKMKLAVLNRS